MRVNKRELSQIFGVTERALTLWQDEGMPIAVKGKRGTSNHYDTADVITWRVQTEISKATGEMPKDRLARVQADRVEIDIAEKLGRLIPVDEIAPLWSGYVAAARQYLRAEPARLAHILDITEGVEAKREKLQAVIDEFLNKLAGIGQELTEDDESDVSEGGGEDRPTPEADSGAVGRAIPVPERGNKRVKRKVQP
jgi:terminase small subunit / prophage DNA-packing protein